MKIDSAMIQDQLRDSARLIQHLEKTSAESIQLAAEILIRAIKNGNKILLCGNGGSAADCQHIAAELVGRYRKNRRGLSAIALTTDTSILTAVGNDSGFDQIYRRQVEALGKGGDVLVGMTTSGSSKNVLLALEEAKAKKMKTIAFIGKPSEQISSLTDVVITVPSSDTPRIQEVHIVIGHILCDIVERFFFETG